jgi:peptidoglycan hydrolase-like protein with peptidoglycan-binding domain
MNAVFAIGTKGQEIIDLQKFLSSKGYMSAQLITGYFGQITSSALTRYKNEMLAKNVGTATQCPVGFICTTIPTGQSLASIPKFTQNREVGYRSLGSETDYFGPATKSALQRFQNSNSGLIYKTAIPVEGNGLLDEKTREYINSKLK